MSMAAVISAIKQGQYQRVHAFHATLIACQEYLNKDTKSPSGLSCIKHAYAMCMLLDYLAADADTINACLLYSMVEYGDLPADDLDDLSDAVFALVAGMQTMGSLHQVYSASRFNDNVAATDAMRRMMLAMVHDGRTVLIKLVEQVVILLHSKEMSAELRDKLAQETMMIYAPLANRLGLSELKWQLEDLAFRIKKPEVYRALSEGLSLSRKRREELVQNITEKLKGLLQANNIVVIDCYGRAKHLYSLYRKMQRKNLSLQEIYDAIAIRILVDSVEACYQVLSLVHANWSAILAEFDDYIANPKPNGYQSLHTAIMHEQSPIEIQIRTESMHTAAEMGVAAHWLYKEGAQVDVKNKAKWLAQLTEASSGSVELQTVNTFEQNAIRLFQDRVFVFTPTGEVKDLMKGATALDFAYAIHSQIGHRCKGVKLNGRIVPIKTVLKNGDRLEVLTHKQPQPSKDWLKAEAGFLRTPKARAKVAQWLRMHDAKTQGLGQNILQKFARTHKLDLNKIVPQVLTEQNITLEILHYKLGLLELKPAVVFADFLPKIEQIVPASEALEVPRKQGRKQKSGIGVLVKGFSGVQTTLAACCFPVPNDQISGLVTSNRGVVVHRVGCSNLTSANPEKIIEVVWLSDSEAMYEVQLTCSCIDFHRANDALQTLLASEKLRLTHLHLINKHAVEFEQAIFEFRLMVRDSAQIEKIINALQARKSITNVWR